MRDPRITESSGLVASQAHPGLAYTVNDSGDSGQRSDPLRERARVEQGAGRFVAVGETGRIYNSADGATWTEVSSPVTNSLRAVAVAFADGVDAAVCDGDAGHATAKPFRAPRQRRSVAGPFLEQALLGRDAVALRSAPLRPVGRGGKGGGGKGGGGEGEGEEEGGFHGVEEWWNTAVRGKATSASRRSRAARPCRGGRACRQQ